MTFDEIIPKVLSLDEYDRMCLLIYLAQQIKIDYERMSYKCENQEARINAALKINKNKDVANLLEEDK